MERGDKCLIRKEVLFVAPKKIAAFSERENCPFFEKVSKSLALKRLTSMVAE